MEEKIIESMSKEVREWFAKAVVGMILADGRIDQSELDYLKGIISFLNEPELIDLSLKLLESDRSQELDQIEIKGEEAVCILGHLASISIVDEHLDSNEEKYLRYVAECLHLSSDIPDLFLTQARERLKGNRTYALIETDTESFKAICLEISENDCLLFMGEQIAPFSSMLLRLFDNHQKGELFNPVRAQLVWCREKRTIMGKFLGKVCFDERLTEERGKRLITKKKKISC